MKVTLVDRPQFPVETVYVLWEMSRTQLPVPSPAEIARVRKIDPVLDQKVKETFSLILKARIPTMEAINFVFALEDVPISLREQMVRHRVGHKFGDKLGVDILPDLPSSTWWSQTSRMLDLGSFAKQKDYFVPESIQENARAYDRYKELMETIALTYNEFKGLGIPLEDARQIIPMACTHRITWTLNLSSLTHLLQKRTCWIAQLGLWKDVIEGFISELRAVAPEMNSLADPPCIKDDKFGECPYHIENINRVQGMDEIPPCSLWLHNCSQATEAAEKFGKDAAWQKEGGRWFSSPSRSARYSAMQAAYARLWGRSPQTGLREAKVV